MSTGVARKGREDLACGLRMTVFMTMPALETPIPSVLRFVAVRRTVFDARRATAFYCDGLGFHVIDTEGAAYETVIALGAQRLVLVESRSAAAPTVSGPDVRFQHLAIVASDMGVAFERLQKLAPVAISRDGPQRLPAASGGVCAFKFRDPDGHPVELITFPAGQGAACWSAPSQRFAGPTLGIDHAAISVCDADRSIAFYQELGFSLQARQINRGIEQAQLDGLDCAQVEVEVVALGPPQTTTPHLELLAYHTPASARGNTDVLTSADQLVWQADATHLGSGSNADSQQKWDIMDPDGHRNRIVK